MPDDGNDGHRPSGPSLRARLGLLTAAAVALLLLGAPFAYRSAQTVALGDALIIAAIVVSLLGAGIGYAVQRFLLEPARRLLTPPTPEDAPWPRAIDPHVSRELRALTAPAREALVDCQRRLDHLMDHDRLTDLPNRIRFRDRLIAAIEKAQQGQSLVGVLFIDLDRFKQVNDSYGHATGDQMLIRISERLRQVFRQDDLIARMGGDEFAVLLEDLHQREMMTELALKALDAIRRPYQIDGRLFYSSASVGIAVAPDDGVDPDRLIQLADAAMYAAKSEEGPAYRFVSSELTASAAAQHRLENDLRDALRDHRLTLHFQPVTSIDTRNIHSYEALLRWPHATQGMLSPASFMNAVSDAGLCTQTSDWVLDQLQTTRPGNDAVIAINLSARLLHDPAFAQRLLERLDEGRLQAARLVLEITEDTLETDLRAAARVLLELRQRGVRIALDDFGTGRASLSHLRRFPFDYLKIDRSFVAGIGKVPNDEKLIQAIIPLAHALSMKVIAEGVETEAQRAFLETEGCDYIQGFLVGRPAASA